MQLLSKIQRIQDAVKSLRRAQDNSTVLVHELALQNKLLRRELEREREKRADELEKIELRLRLELSQELRRLPPGAEN